MRYPIQCYIEITDQCNLKCSHCFASAQKTNKNFLNLNDIKNIYSQIEHLGIVYVNISGGEPLLNPEFFEIMELTSHYNYYVSLLTNGILWTETSINKLKSVINPKNVLIQISIDGQYELMNKQRNMTAFEYKKVLDNIQLFKDAGFSVGSLLCASIHTIDNALETSKWALEHLKIDAIQIVPELIAGRAKLTKDELKYFWCKWKTLIILLTDIKKYHLWNGLEDKIRVGFFTLYELAYPLDSINRHEDIKGVWNYEFDNKDMFVKLAHRNCFCEIGNSEIVIDSKGELYPCVASIKSNWNCGSLKKKKIDDIWSNSDILNKFREKENNLGNVEPCKSCVYREICNGGCSLAKINMGYELNDPDPRCSFVLDFEGRLK